jgi:hypothetical protein
MARSRQRSQRRGTRRRRTASSSFKVMIRPLKAVDLIHQKMAAMLQK